MRSCSVLVPEVEVLEAGEALDGRGEGDAPRVLELA
jgi:hypothetical protein